MKNKILILIAIMTLGLVSSCDQDEDRILFDVNNQDNAIAQLNGGSVLVFNPVEETSNFINVGVSTVSDQPRTFTVSLNEDDSTLDPSFYVIPSLTGTIPAGSFVGQLEVITPLPTTLPANDRVIVVNLESVEGAQFLPDALVTETIGVTVACPSVDTDGIPGTYRIVQDDFETTVGDNLFEIIAGPEANQYTMVNPFDHPNPADGGAQSYNVIIDIDPATGESRIARQDAWHCDNFGCGFGQGRIDGSGLTLTCINQIQFPALRHTVDAGSFGSFTFIIEKQ